MNTAKTIGSLAICTFAIAAASLVLGAYGEPVNAALWRDLLWGL
jgi:hypothetical protein